MGPSVYVPLKCLSNCAISCRQWSFLTGETIIDQYSSQWIENGAITDLNANDSQTYF